MKNKIVQLIMKHPLASICIVFGMVIPNYFALVLFGWQGIREIGFLMTLGTSIIFAFIPICVWGVAFIIARYTFENTMLKTELKDVINYMNEWDCGITTVCIINFVYCSISLFICYCFSIGFKWYFIMSLLIPIIRIIVAFAEYRYYLKKTHESI